MTDEPVAEVQLLPNAWHLVTVPPSEGRNGWEISVAPDGLLMLPRHLKPADVLDFVICARAAAEVGEKVRAENAERAAKDGGTGLPVGAVIVREGPPPPGAVRLPYSTIGRSKGGRGRQAAARGRRNGSAR